MLTFTFQSDFNDKGMDVAASEFLKDGKYDLDFKTANNDGSLTYSGPELANIYKDLVSKYPIVSIEGTYFLICMIVTSRTAVPSADISPDDKCNILSANSNSFRSHAKIPLIKTIGRTTRSSLPLLATQFKS